MRATSSLPASLAAAGIKPAERRIEFLHHLAERGGERSPPADQHIVVAGTQSARPGGRRQPNDLPQAPPHAVAFHRIADLPRHREADADRPFLGAPPRLQHEPATGSAIAVGRGSKIAAASEPLNNRLAFPLTH